jgi:glycerate dehydrogenase
LELADKTLDIVGFGRIGRQVGELAHAFGMGVLAHTRSPAAPPAYQPFAWAGPDELFAHADVISLHCSLNPETAGLVNRERLQRVRPGAFLINTSRGGLIVEEDLADALKPLTIMGRPSDIWPGLASAVEIAWGARHRRRIEPHPLPRRQASCRSV